MSPDLTALAPDRDQVRESLGELRRASEEFEFFVADQLDQLETLHARLEQREGELNGGRDELERQLADVQESRRRWDEANAAAERCASELRDAAERFASETGRDLKDEVAALRDQRERLRDELDAARLQATSLAQTVTADLAEARAGLVATSDELARQREQLVEAEAPWRQALAACANALERQGTERTAPLPAAACATEPSNNAADDDPHLRDEGHDAWRGELNQLRSQLDNSAQLLADRPATALPAATPDDPNLASGKAPQAVAASASDESVFDALMAQFEMLQNDLVGPRTPGAEGKAFMIPTQRATMPRYRHQEMFDSPSVVLAAQCQITIEQLGLLDDTVFEAIAGRPGALESLRTLWPEVKALVGAGLIEESREQYVRHALKMWRDCVSGEEVRNPALAVAAMEVVSLLFDE